LASPACTIRDGVAVEGLLAEPGPDGIPVVTGVVTSAGPIPADLTVVAGGRRRSGPRRGRGHRHRLLLALLRDDPRRRAPAERRPDRRRPRLPEVRDL